MHMSMRRERKLNKKRDSRDDARGEARLEALKHIQKGLSVRQTYDVLKPEYGGVISHGTVGSIRKAWFAREQDNLDKLMNPKEHRAGRRHILSKTEQQMMVKAAIRDSVRAKAWTATDMRIAMGKLANDGRERAFKLPLPCPSVLRKFRADNPELTFRNKTNKEFCKIQGENYEHVKTLQEVLKSVFESHSDIRHDPDRVWNMDETSIDCEFGVKEKVASSSSSNLSGSHICSDNSGGGVHVTCVVAVSASGLKCPPFFIIQGKYAMSAWTAPVEGDPARALSTTVFERFTREEWFPGDGVKMMSDKGSMTMELLPIFIRHFNTFARKFVSKEKSILLTLDGHSSRKGVAWIEEAIRSNIEIAKTPANTSHKLQPCDQKVNKTLKKAVRLTRDRMVSCGLVNAKSVKFKLICALAAIDDISINDIRASFSDIGLWPMDFRFLENFRKNKDKIKEEVDSRGDNARIPDSQTAQDCLKIFLDKAMTPEAQLQKVEMMLQNRQTVNKILLGMKKSVSQRTARSSNNSDDCTEEKSTPDKPKQKSHRLFDGRVEISPARHLTHAESVKRLREQVAEKQREEEAKESRKRERARKKLENDANKGVAKQKGARGRKANLKNKKGQGKISEVGCSGVQLKGNELIATTLKKVSRD